MKNIKLDAQFKPRRKTKQQKGRTILIYMQKTIEVELKYPAKKKHVQKLDEVREDTFAAKVTRNNNRAV